MRIQGSEKRNVTRLSGVLLGISAAGLLLLGGCGHKQTAQNAENSTQPAAASTTGTTAAAPAPTQSAKTSAPAATRPAAPARAAAPAAKTYTVPAGTRVSVRMGQTLHAKTANVGEGFDGTLANAIRVGGVTVIGAGTPVSGTVIAAKGQGRFKGEGDLGITLNRIGSETVRTSDYVASVKGKGKRTAVMTGGGAGGGALIGGLAGGGKGALIGGLIGAAAGGAGSAFTGNKALEIPAESIVSFSLRSAITVTK